MADDGLIREIDEAVRQEQWQKLWHKHGKRLLTILVIALAVLVGLVAWQEYSESKQREWTDVLLQAHQAILSDQGNEAVLLLDKTAKDAPPKLAALARIWLAKSYLLNNDTDMAIATLQTAVSNNADKELTDYARLMLAQLNDSGQREANATFPWYALEQSALQGEPVSTDAQTALPPSLNKRLQELGAAQSR